MKLKVTEVDVWAASIEDRPGGLAEKLAALTAAGSNLEFVLAHKASEQTDTGVVFVNPLKGAKQVQAATAAGFVQSGSVCSLRIEGTDKPGLGAKMTKGLAEAGINLRGLSAAAIGTKFVCYLAFDTADDAKKATDTLQKLS
jgi:hypothetical protein